MQFFTFPLDFQASKYIASNGIGGGFIGAYILEPLQVYFWNCRHCHRALSRDTAQPLTGAEHPGAGAFPMGAWVVERNQEPLSEIISAPGKTNPTATNLPSSDHCPGPKNTDSAGAKNHRRKERYAFHVP